MTNHRAQASTEFLLILASTLVVLAAVIVISQQQAVAIVDVNAQTQARNAAQDLAAGAREVYSQGAGARKQIFIQLPSSYNASGSQIANRSIQVRVAGTDYVTGNDFDMEGTLPVTAGGHLVWLISEGSRVRIGTGLLRLNKAGISIVIDRNSSRSETFSVRNVFDSSINVLLTPEWGNPDVFMSLSTPPSFSLDPGESQDVQLTFQSSSGAVGFYNGDIAIHAASGNTSESQTLSVTVEVVLPATADKLSVTPPSWDVILPPGNTTNQAFSVCTGPGVSVPFVAFTTTAGAAGDWIGNTSALPAMNPATCVSKFFSLAVPANASLGTYGAAIFADGGSSDVQDSVDVTVYVVRSSNDTQGPRVSDIRHQPRPVYVGNPVTIYAVGDDSATGNSSLVGCQLQLDSDTSWRSMDAADGTYDSPRENISLAIGSFSGGTHTVHLRCTDVAGNVGPSANYTFSLLKPILEVTQDNGGGTPANDWETWLNTHTSAAGFSWAHDRYQRQDVVAGGVNISLYRILVIPEDITSGSPGDQFMLLLQNYTSAGGSVVFVDKSAEHAFEDLGYSSSHSSTSRRYVYIPSNSSYLTSGFPVGYDNLYPSDTRLWLQKGFGGGTAYATSESDLLYPALAQRGQYFVWGVTNPNTFLSAGHNLTGRVLDYAITSSTIGN